MELKNFFAQDPAGNILPGATCYLYQPGTANLVTGLQDKNGAPLANPFTAGENGLIQFAAPNGAYDLRVTSGGRDYRVRVQCVDVAEQIQAAQLGADRASEEATRAGTEADRAEIARDAAQASASIYQDTSAGLAATTNGQYFSVPSAESSEYLILYLNNGGVAVEQKRYPSANAVQGVKADQIGHKRTLTLAGQKVYTGSGAVTPFVTDAASRVLFGYDKAEGSIIAKGLVREKALPESINRTNAQAGAAHYTGTGAIIPLWTDLGNRVLLGYDRIAGQLVGAFPAGESGTTGPVSTPLKALPDAQRPQAAGINHLLFYGQSLSVGATGQPVISTAQPYANLTFNGGPRAATDDYSALKPLVEDALPAPDGSSNRGETPCSGAANFATELAAIESGLLPADHVILASTAGRGGYKISELNKGTAWYPRVLEHITNGHSLALAAGKTHALHAFGWIQGEADANPSGPSQSVYRDQLAQLRADIEADAQAITGQSKPVFCITYQLSYNAKTYPKIALAQLELAKTNPLFAFATPCYHLPFSGDLVHLTADGYKWLGHYFGRAYKRLVMDGVKPAFINPISATCRGSTLLVRFEVPVLPLVLDVASLAATTDFGFKVSDDAGALALSNIAVVDGNTLRIDLSRGLGANPVVRYALDYQGAGLIFNNGASGNLRDSEPTTTTIAGVLRPLYNVCPHFQLPIVALA